ncbi:hypothetical protein HUE87_00690 [Candidatus Sulfurimonas marisnigri]|uniref:Cytochrome c domain-containing protein n=1 Tax=Candidatus Sulfurimonas marisnigri TaxID=2740405 RepID=A0A7S7M0Q8_9BACT|nr:hypothetical protein [Candidatus Sulfurimonas marisnigri]QOY54800.1 hypothetical protein HUE87_00690 [Candidatus Sulfurimonas marisnigri]
MVKKTVLILSLMFCIANADVYKNNCVKCHEQLPISIDKYFYKYLLIYSSETDMKNAIISYLKYPAKETTVMSDAFVIKFGIKKKTKLSEAELKEAVDVYWQKYKVFGKLK